MLLCQGRVAHSVTFEPQATDYPAAPGNETMLAHLRVMLWGRSAARIIQRERFSRSGWAEPGARKRGSDKAETTGSSSARPSSLRDHMLDTAGIIR